MNWDAIGAIAELLGAIGVIASLVYLASQIRHSREQMSQNTQALRTASYQQLFQSQEELISRGLIGPGLQQAVRLGMADFDQLSEEDAHHFTYWITPVLLGFENTHYQYRAGMLDEDRWNLRRSHLALAFLKQPGTISWWKNHPGKIEVFGPQFVALVEEILGEDAEGSEVKSRRPA